MSLSIFMIRLSICFCLSILVGIERQLRHKIVGLRTNVLVCIGAFLFVYLSFGVNETKTDVTRIAAQVVSGIGFLGAGVILKDGSKIKGLNTAATLWCMAAIGVLCAAGLEVEATIGAVFVLFSNIILRMVSLYMMNKIKDKASEKYTINIKCQKNMEEKIKNKLIKIIEQKSLILDSLERNEITDDVIILKIIIITNISNYVEPIINKISTIVGIISINWEHQKISKSDNEDFDEE